MKYQCQDLWIAAYLLYLVGKGEVQFDEAILEDTGNVMFLFTPYDVCEKAIKKYMNRQAELAHPKDLFSSYAEAKQTLTRTKYGR